MPCIHHQTDHLLKSRINSASHEVYSVAAEVCPLQMLCLQQPYYASRAKFITRLRSKPSETAEYLTGMVWKH